MSDPLYEDPVVAEIHRIRAKMLAECGGDHRKLMESVGRRQELSGRKIIRAPIVGGILAEQRPIAGENTLTSAADGTGD